ncbi:MAG TPA: arginine deiminase family protein [Ktedonobacteraceae bacterium]|nr:arginine deiminase family protein [Ktedonobacteraceae bacterium]
MTRRYGCQDMLSPLRTVIVKRPDQAFGAADPQAWHYSRRPNLPIAQEEHDALTDMLRKSGAEVIYHDEYLPDYADAIFAFDPSLVTDHGAIILSMGKEKRRGEEAAMARTYERLGIPIKATLHGEARAEGGDLLWVDHDTLAVGLGFRTNAEGLRQLREILAAIGVTVIPVELPYYTGPEACLHLLSMISIVDYQTAVVYPPLMAVPFWQELHRRDFHLLEIPEVEYATMASNVLALAPRKCLMLEGNPLTKRLLEEAGCEVMTYRGNEISLKAEGGPTCLTRPVWREYPSSILLSS